MKVRVAIAALLALSAGVGLSTPAMAIGCLSGGAAGAVAGHMAHHGVLGAIGGCIAGHEYNKHHQKSESDTYRNSRSNEPGYDRHGEAPNTAYRQE